MDGLKIKPEQIVVTDVGNKKHAEVKGCESLVKSHLATATVSKQSEKAWEAGKTELRELTNDVVELGRTYGTEFAAVNFVADNTNIIEVVPSNKRKALTPKALELIRNNGFESFLVEETEITVKGDLALWLLSILGDRTDADPNFKMTKRKVLAPAFGNTPTIPTAAFMELSKLGLYAPAVEPKVRK